MIHSHMKQVTANARLNMWQSKHKNVFHKNNFHSRKTGLKLNFHDRVYIQLPRSAGKFKKHFSQ